MPEDFLRRALFEKPPQVHDRHAIGDMPDDVEVVCDDDHCQSEAVLQSGQEIQDVSLYRHVQSCGGLVRDNKFRIKRQCAGDTDSSGLPARKLVRITIGKLGTQANQIQKPQYL